MDQLLKTEQKQINYFVIMIAIVAAIAGILFGFDTGVISGAILFIQQKYSLTPAMNGVVVSAVLFGALVGAALGGRFSDYFGRKKLLIATAVIFIIGTILSAIAPTVSSIIVGRFVVGLAIGLSSFAAPLYISEISPPKYRGALVSLNQLMITIGILVSYMVDYSLAQGGHWRLMLGSGIIPALIFLVGLTFLPASPRWMVLKNLVDKARITLIKIRQSENVDAEISAIQESVEQQKDGDWRLLFKPWVLPAVIIGLGLAFFQQVTGINTIIYYAPTIFKMAGFQSSAVAILATMGVGVVNVIFTIIALPLIDRWGRRPLLLIGLTGMAISLAFMSYSFAAHSSSGTLKWFMLGSMVLYIMCFAISLGPIMWLVIAEVFPLKIRGLASSSAIAASWAFNMIVALTFLSLIHGLGTSKTFLVYFMLSVLGWIFVYFIVPETKGVSLEKIEENLRNRTPSRDLGVPRKPKRV